MYIKFKAWLLSLPVWQRMALIVAVGAILFSMAGYQYGGWLERRHDAQFRADMARLEAERSELKAQAAQQEQQLGELSSVTTALRAELSAKDAELKASNERLAELARTHARLVKTYDTNKTHLHSIADGPELERFLRAELERLGFDTGKK